jgi:hypothetical protein
MFPLLAGCTGDKLDFCRLLSVSEVQEFHPGVSACHMDVRGKAAPTNYAIYTTGNNDEVFLLSIGNVTKNPPYQVLEAYMVYLEGENTVEPVTGIGNSAAALFSDDFDADKFRILIANGDDWSVTIRAAGIVNVDADRFHVLKKLGNLALERF